MSRNFKKRINKYSETIDEKTRKVMICEGETEKMYFDLLKSKSIIPYLDKVMLMKNKAITHEGFLQNINSHRNSVVQKKGSYDDIYDYYFVVDADFDNKVVKAICQLSKEYSDKYVILYSNPTFELWMNFHSDPDKAKSAFINFSGKKCPENYMKTLLKENKPYKNTMKKFQNKSKEEINKIFDDACKNAHKIVGASINTDECNNKKSTNIHTHLKKI